MLHQAPFKVNYYDYGGDGIGTGDLYTWIAPFTAEDGRTGTIAGEHQTVTMPTEGPFREVRIGSALLHFGNGDKITLGGLITAAMPGQPLAPGAEEVNAITGGTGAFAGAKGEVRSLRAQDGSWTHTLSYRSADRRLQGRTLTDITLPLGVAVDTNWNGMIDAGDFRTFHWQSTVTDCRGDNLFLTDPGVDGSPAWSYGYVACVIDGDVLITVAGHTPVTDNGQLVGPAANTIVGGTGRFAGATGERVIEQLGNGSFKASINLLPEPAGTLDRRLVLHTGFPHLVNRNLGTSSSMGDQQACVLPFTSDDGKAGNAYGYGWTVKPASGLSDLRTVLGLISLQFSDGSTLLIAELHAEHTALPQAADERITRAVIGGTGAFAGVSGEVVTTLDGAGGLIHTFTLLAE